MSFEEDTELRDLVIETLEKKGVLGKIKAELRATVFLALEDSDFEKCKIPLRNEALQKFMETDEGRTTVAVIRNFLETFNLDYALAVFDPEVSCPGPIPSKKELETKLHLEPTNKEFVPILLPILRKFETSYQPVSTTEKSSYDSLNSEKNAKSEVKTAWLSGKSKEEKKDVEKVVEPTTTANKDNIENKDDDFFDDPIPSTTKEPLLFSFLGSSSNSVKDVPTKDTKEDETFLTNSNVHRKTSASSLSSLQDLPTLGEGIKSTKTNLEYEDDFQSSLSSHSGKYESKLNPKDLKDSLPDDGDGSLEEEIEEDLSASADDLLNSSLSQGEALTSDRTISRLSGKSAEVVYSESVQNNS